MKKCRLKKRCLKLEILYPEDKGEELGKVYISPSKRSQFKKEP